MDCFPRTVSTANRAVWDYIESTVTNILREIEKRPPGRPIITLRHPTSLTPYFDRQHRQLSWHVGDREVTYSFPGRNQDEAWRFACVFRVLCEVQNAICEGVVVSKRDIFYRDPALFIQQATVDRHIDNLAHTCKVGRKGLNVTASPKGLVAGLQPSDSPSEPETIPDATTVIDGTQNHFSWILVVEKEATFKSLVGQRFHRNRRIGPGVLVTAKGYPDLVTRSFVRRLLDRPASNTLVLGLFDYDPYGIDIMRCYRFGSKSTRFEKDTNIPELKWLGLKAEEAFAAPYSDGSSRGLTQQDRHKAHNMLSSFCLEEAEANTALEDIQTELRRMLILNRKAEIQAMDEGLGLCVWLEKQIAAELGRAVGE